MLFRLRTLKLGLRAKLTFMIGGCVVILRADHGNRNHHARESRHGKRASQAGPGVGLRPGQVFVRPLLGHDLATLRRFLIHSMDQEYVRYAMILDPNGKVVMHSDLSQVDNVYTDSLSIAAMKSRVAGYTDVHTGEHEELHCDIYVPIQVGDFVLGTVRLGYSHLAIEKEISAARREVLIFGLFTMIVGGVAAYFLAAFIALPIKRITNAIGNVAGGNGNIGCTKRSADLWPVHHDCRRGSCVLPGRLHCLADQKDHQCNRECGRR